MEGERRRRVELGRRMRAEMTTVLGAAQRELEGGKKVYPRKERGAGKGSETSIRKPAQAA